jgi:squalene-associated FAD-dependent desaturase
VAVVGGGLAGLAAAWDIARAGVEAVVLERKSSPGGRAGSAIDEETGEPVDTGQHIFMGCYRSTLDWFAALGTRPSIRFQSGLAVPFLQEGGTVVSLRAAPLPAPFHLLAGLLRLPGLTFREKIRVLRLGRVLVPGAADDGMSVSEWEDRLGVPSLVRAYALEPLALAALNENPCRVSARPFTTVLKTLALAGWRGSAIGFASTGLGDTYIGPAAAGIERAGGSLRSGAWASGLLVKRGRVAGVRLAGGEEMEADAVVLAVPPGDLAPLAAGVRELEGIVMAAGRLEPSPIATVHLWWDRPVFRELFAGFAGGTFDFVFNRTGIIGPNRENTQHLCVVRSAARDLLGLKPGEMAARAEECMRRFVPDSAGAKVVRHRTVWETRATVSLAPGTNQLRPGPGTALPGLVLAGDWTATGLPATIEGAVQSGMAAARMILANGRG